MILHEIFRVVSRFPRYISCYIAENVVENMILHEIFRVVSRFPHYISCYIAESRFPLGQCTTSYQLS